MRLSIVGMGSAVIAMVVAGFVLWVRGTLPVPNRAHFDLQTGALRF